MSKRTQVYYKDTQEYVDNCVFNPPTDEDMDQYYIDQWFIDHEIVITIAGKVISLPYTENNVNNLIKFLLKGEQENG